MFLFVEVCLYWAYLYSKHTQASLKGRKIDKIQAKAFSLSKIGKLELSPSSIHPWNKYTVRTVSNLRR
jgi:hypothetical protein